PVGAIFGVGNVSQSLLDFARGADAHLIPVEESLLQIVKGAVGLLARGALAQDRIKKLLEYRAGFRLARIITLFQRREHLRDHALLVDCYGHILSTLLSTPLLRNPAIPPPLLRQRAGSRTSRPLGRALR